MPEIQDGHRSNLTHYIREADQSLTADSPDTASILRSVEEQEARFEQLTQELQRDKLLVARQVQKSELASETESVHSISTTNDSFSFRKSAVQESTVDGYLDDAVDGPDIIESAVKTLEEANMATMDSMQHSNYDNYPHLGSADYDNPSYHNSPTRSNFTHDEPGSPHGSYHSQQPYSNPEHRNPPPFGGSDGYAPPPSDDFGYQDDYSQRDPSGVTSGYDSDTLNRDPYLLDTLPPEGGGEGIPGPGDGYGGDPNNDQGYHGEEPSYHGDDYARDGGPVGQSPYANYSGPYDGPDGGDVRRSPFEADVSPQGAPIQEAGFGANPMDGEDLDLADVIESLSSHQETEVINAARYLTHLTYGDDDIKNKTRGLNGIPILVELLNNPMEDIHSPASKALRNLSYGKRNEQNKVAIKNADGVATLVRLLKHTGNEEIREVVTGILWNLSSVEPIKMVILDEAVKPLMHDILIPETGWDPQTGGNRILRNEQPWSKVFTNCLGVLRNVSSAGGEQDASVRRQLRNYPGLLEILINILSGAVGGNELDREMDTKCVEHAICIIRNLSFRASQEINHPDTTSSKTATMGSKGRQKSAPPAGKADVFSCFSAPKDKKSGSSNKNANNKSSSMGRGNLEQASLDDSHKPQGVEYLWNLGSIRVYVTLLSDGSNPVTLEAAAGTIQNITTGDSRMATGVRSCVRKEKGLPVMVELLRIDNDKVVLSLARALRNLAVDTRNTELIGQYAMKDLVIRLPGGGSDNAIKPLAMESLTAILHLLQEVIKNNQDHAIALRNAGGIDAVVGISKGAHSYPKPVIKASIMVLHTLWAYKDLRGSYRHDGYQEKDFVTGTWTVKRHPGQGPPRTQTNGHHPDRPVDSPGTLTRSSQSNHYSAPLPVGEYPYGTIGSRSGYDQEDSGGLEERTAGSDYQPSLDFTFIDPAAYIRDSYSTYSSEDLLDQRDNGPENIPMENYHYQDQGSDIGSLSRTRPPVGGVSVYGRTPEPQVETRLADPQDTYRQEPARSPSHDSNYASDYARGDTYRRDDYGHHDDYSHRDDRSHHDDHGSYTPQEELSRQGSFQPVDYGTAGRNGYHGDGGRTDDYGYAAAEYGQGDYSHQSGNYAVKLSPDSELQEEPASDSWV